MPAGTLRVGGTPVKTAIFWEVARLVAQMPFPNKPGMVTGGLQ